MSYFYFAGLHGPAIYDRYMDDGRQMTRLLVESIQSYLTPGMKVLDIGTGTGFVAFAIAALVEGGQIVGVDADENALVFARYKAQKQGIANITFQKGDALQLDFADGSFDMVLANQLPLDHEKVLGDMKRVTRPGGIIAIARPHSPQSQYLQFIYDVGCEIARQQGKTPPEKPVYTRSQPGVIRPIFEQLGLEILVMEEKKFFQDNLDRALLALVVEAEFPFLIAYTAQLDESDTPAMIQGYLDFLEARQTIFDEKYNGKIEVSCLIAVGRKPHHA